MKNIFLLLPAILLTFTSHDVFAGSDDNTDGMKKTFETAITGYKLVGEKDSSEYCAPGGNAYWQHGEEIDGKIKVTFEEPVRSHPDRPRHGACGPAMQIVQPDTMYEIDTKKLLDNPYWANGPTWGVLVVPYKYELHDHSFQPGGNFGIYAGYLIGKPPLAARVVASIGASQVPKSDTTKSSNSEAGSTGGGYAALAALFNVSKIQVGLVFGTDLAKDSEYNGKGWFAISIGTGLF